MSVAVDFETYYDDEYSVKDLDADGYCYHPKFNPYLVSVVGEGIEFVGHPSEFNWDSINGKIWVSHNARFDATVFEAAVAKQIIRGQSHPSAWYCTADLAVYCGAPRDLKGAAKALLGKEISKAVRLQMKGRTVADRVVKDYALSDSQLCLEIWEKYNDRWPEHERQVSYYNRIWGSYGVNVDTKALNAAIKSLAQLRWEAEQNIPWDWSEGKTPLALGSIREECRKEGIPAPSSFAQTSEDCIKWEDEYSPKFPWIAAVRQWRRVNMLLTKLETMRLRVRVDGILPYSTKYFGAHTGRFSGSGGFNIQNMPRLPIFGVDLRSLIIPRPGMKFVISDLEQIEARILLYLAEDHDTLALIREKGISVYEAYARAHKLWEKQGELKKGDPALYQLVKAMVLGLGYGCGRKRFKDVAWLLARLEITDEQSSQYVDMYRESNPKVLALWDSLQQVLSYSAHAPEKMLELDLPSGRTLTYRNVTATVDGYAAQTMINGPMLRFYGGKLTENLVQATARDVLTNAFAPLDNAGLRPLFHIHDEVVCEVDARIPDADVKETVRSIMSRTPSWLGDCPIGATSEVHKCYTK